mmetsp:Transcript_69334/g.153024  ORF Transcript_69334/g.153024 Transcript_69334/m.153024 type:complete len:215 (-) Transcript_69334:504-1148(-)
MSIPPLLPLSPALPAVKARNFPLSRPRRRPGRCQWLGSERISRPLQRYLHRPPAPPSRMARPSLHRLDLPGSSPPNWRESVPPAQCPSHKPPRSVLEKRSRPSTASWAHWRSPSSPATSPVLLRCRERCGKERRGAVGGPGYSATAQTRQKRLQNRSLLHPVSLYWSSHHRSDPQKSEHRWQAESGSPRHSRPSPTFVGGTCLKAPGQIASPLV